jgi:hypothetical protein
LGWDEGAGAALGSGDHRGVDQDLLGGEQPSWTTTDTVHGETTAANHMAGVTGTRSSLHRAPPGAPAAAQAGSHDPCWSRARPHPPYPPDFREGQVGPTRPCSFSVANQPLGGNQAHCRCPAPPAYRQPGGRGRSCGCLDGAVWSLYYLYLCVCAYGVMCVRVVGRWRGPAGLCSYGAARFLLSSFPTLWWAARASSCATRRCRPLPALLLAYPASARRP